MNKEVTLIAHILREKKVAHTDIKCWEPVFDIFQVKN